MIHAARSCLISIKNWLILPSCSICGQFSPEYLLCPECLKKLDDDRLEFSDDSGVCNLPGLGAVPVLSLFCTSSFSKKLIHQIKYSGKTRLIDALVNQSGVLPDLAGWTLVPVPLHPCRKRERGFNQAALIAGCIAKNCGGIVRNDWLERSIATNSQTGKDKTGRFKNMNNVFRLSAKARSEMPGFRGKILIVDDINDSGATFKWIAQDWEVNNDSEKSNVKFAALIDNIPSEFVVEYSGTEINKEENPEWIVFPYEEWW